MVIADPTQRDVLATAAAWSRWVVVCTIAIFAGVAALAPAFAAPAVMVVAAVGFVAGVPHGAVDHLLAIRLSGARGLPVVIAVYAGLAVLVWLVLRWTGPVALLVVVALSAVHFGLGELEVSRALTGWRPNPMTAIAVVVASCGALLLPLARSGGQWQTVAAAVSPELARMIAATSVQIALGALWVVGALIAVTAAQRAQQRAVVVDLVLIGALGLLAPPLIAFAVWFGSWHALRHMARILTVEPECAGLLTVGRPREAVLRLARLAALPSLAALTVLAALVWFTAAAPDSSAALAEVLRLLLALTVPHMVVVFWLDRLSAMDSQQLPSLQSGPVS